MAISNQSDKDSILGDAIEVGALTTAPATIGYLNNKYSNSNLKNNLSEFASKLAGADYLNNQMNRSISTTSGQVLSTANQSLQKTLLSQLMALEEMSPLHILRTLQLSNFIQPFTELSQSNEIIHISANQVRNQQHYYTALLKYVNDDAKLRNKRNLELRDLNRGLFFHKNALYGATKEGKIDLNDRVLSNARLTLGSVKNGEIQSANHIFEKYSDIIGGKLNKQALKSDPLMVIGAKSNLDFSAKWANSTMRFAMEVGFKTLDNPVAGVEEMLHGVGANYTGLFQSKSWQTLKKYTNIKLGTGGVYNLGIRDSLKLSAKNLAIKGTGVYLGYQGLDSLVRTLSPSDGVFSQGLGAGLTNIYGSARIGFAELWSDRFQGYKERQEQAAPGSTDLSKLMAFPLAGALLGSQMAYFGRVGVASIGGVEKSANIFNVEKESNFLKNFGIDAKLKPMKRNALVGGLIGGALTLPFLPGALIGTSSDELRDLYSGKKDVAEKANKFWLFGGTPWEGSSTKFFTKSLVARMRADATDKVRYGDDETKKKMNPFLHPFSYLLDPYKFEKRNAESMPYPVWGMDVSYGGFFGKIFEKTVGQIIKPDILNPAAIDALQQNTLVVGPNYNDGSTKQSVDTGIVLASDVLGLKHNTGKTLLSVSESFFGTKEGNKLQGISNKDESLIKSGLMVAPDTPTYTPGQEGLSLSYKSLTDFTGIKGWTSSLAIESLGLNPDNVAMQFARSGEADSAARDLLDQNLGDLFGLGEGQRKLLPTSSGSLPERFNPIANNSASWLPRDKAKFFIDFKHGNQYDKVMRGEERLPGVGYAALNPELEGINPEDYPLVYKYKMLTDVARGSREYVQTRLQVLEAYKNNNLSTREVEILGDTLDQEQQLQQKKDFYDKPTGFRGPIGTLQSALWETMRKNSESPLEMLTPLRPSAKFLHERTAIEDYIETQLGGPDTAIWTNPYSHFIKPTLNKSRQALPFGNEFFIPEETRDKYNIDEYFDKFDFLRKRRNGTEQQAMSTIIGSSMSGLNTKDKVLKFKASLQDEQKDYFTAFSNETDRNKREAIRAMLPEDVRRGYEQIWQNVDVAKKARDRGESVQRAIAENLHRQTEKLQDVYDVSLNNEEEQIVRSKVEKNADNYASLGMSKSDRIKYSEDEALRMKMADKEALTYVAKRTGLPSSKFIGWDPRLTTDDIKMRTLSIGGADLKRFGFWKQDEERMNRLEAITDQSNQVFTQLDEIKTNIRSNRNLKNAIERTMFNNGFKASKIDLVDSDYGSILVQENN